MFDAVAKADVLIEALGWIRRFRGKFTVIKLGGSLLDDRDALRHILIDVIFMESVGMRPVLVHGAGGAITQAMQQAGLEARFIRGRRVTDAATLQIVEQVLARDTNHFLVQQMVQLGGQAEGLNFGSVCVLRGEKLIEHTPGEEMLDLGFVGYVTEVDTHTIARLCTAGVVPVIPSMCLDRHPPGKLNVNADTAASAVAEALKAEKLVFLSDVNGVRADRNDPQSLIETLDLTQARELIRNGRIDAGMIPKVEGCLATLERGVQKVHIVDGRLRHSLLLEIFTNRGVGTQFVLQRP